MKYSSTPSHQTTKTENSVLAGLFLALGLILPLLTMQIPELGNKLLPMHLPVLLCGFLCGPRLGLSVGFITPLLRSTLFTMPPIPIASAMAFELAVYGLVSGLIYSRWGRKKISIYFALIISMISGRIAWGIASYFIFGLSGSTFTMKLFLAGAFLNAIPGIIIQLILIPIMVIAAERYRTKRYEA